MPETQHRIHSTFKVLLFMKLHKSEFRLSLSRRLLIFLILRSMDELGQARPLQELFQSLPALFIFNIIFQIDYF